MKKYIVSSQDILNSNPNYRPYAKLKQESEEVEVIHKKYGLSTYQSNYTLATLLYKETSNMQNKLADGVNQSLKECVTLKTGHEHKDWTSNDWEFRGKMCNKEGIYDKIKILREDIEAYDKQLNKYLSEISNSTDMGRADQIAGQIKHYQDSNYGILIARSDEALHDFQVEIMGIDV